MILSISSHPSWGRDSSGQGFQQLGCPSSSSSSSVGKCCEQHNVGHWAVLGGYKGQEQCTWEVTALILLDSPGEMVDLQLQPGKASQQDLSGLQSGQDWIVAVGNQMFMITVF